MLTRILERVTALDTMDGLVDRAAASDTDGSIFASICREMELRCELPGDGASRIPVTGPTIFVCDHPSGFAEGLLVPALLDSVRDDVITMALSWFRRWPVVAERMILVDPRGPGRDNAGAMKNAVRHLRAGGALMMFPAGEVAHGRPGSFESRERPWRPGLGALVRMTGATVVPIHAEISNRRRFHVFSWLNPRLGALLLGREVLAHRGRNVTLRIGRPLAANDFPADGPSEAITETCRRAVSALASQGVERSRPRGTAQCVA